MGIMMFGHGDCCRFCMHGPAESCTAEPSPWQVYCRQTVRHLSATGMLAPMFSHSGGDHFSGEGAGDDMFPYVSFTLNIEG